MRDPKRIPEVLKILEKIWAENPDLRLGQLICNVIPESSLYYIEDRDLAYTLQKYYENEKN